jgi:hypothetical protein
VLDEDFAQDVEEGINAHREPMEPAILGLVLDSSPLIAAERAGRTIAEIIRAIRVSVGEVPIAICALTVAEFAHGLK